MDSNERIDAIKSAYLKVKRIPRPRTIGEPRRAQIAELYLNGSNQEQISEHFGHDIETIRKILREKGINPRAVYSTRRTKSPVSIEVLKRMYVNFGLQACAKHFQTSYPRIRQMLKEAGVLIRPGGRPGI